MIPRKITPEDLAAHPGAHIVTMCAAPEHQENVVDVEVMVDSASSLTMVPFMPNEIEVAQLANGGTLWLVIVGRMPPVCLEVRPKEPG